MCLDFFINLILQMNNINFKIIFAIYKNKQKLKEVKLWLK